LIISESLRAQIGSLRQGINNAQRAANLLATAEGALGEGSALLVNVRELVVEAANSGTLSQEELDANQLQIDSAIESITRIANTTAFGGLKLLNGSLGFTTSGVDSSIEDLSIYSANFGNASSLTVSVNVTQSAQAAQLTWNATSVASTTSIEVAGTGGAEVFTFTSGTNASAIAYAVNQTASLTGVSATIEVSGAVDTGVSMYSTVYGSDEFVSVNVLSGTFDTVDAAAAAATRDTGRDAAGSINGNSVSGSGNTLTFNSRALDLQLTVSAGYAGSSSFTIQGGGGALFQLSPDVSTAGQMNVGLGSVTAARLGRGDIGYLNSVATGGTYDLSSGRLEGTTDIIDAAITDVSTLRGRLGAFEKNVVNTSVNSLRVALENVSAAESLIRDTDFATETSELTRSQILVAAGMAVLAAANQSPQNVLSLLG
jgi:flagellin